MMYHVKQNDAHALPIIQTSGCRFRCDGLAAEYKTGKMLTVDQINNVWMWAQETGRIGNKRAISCDVKAYAPFNAKCLQCPHWADCKYNCDLDGASIATRFLRELGDKGRFAEVGTADKFGVITWYPNCSSSLQHVDFGIQKIRQSGPQATHFILTDESLEKIEDPHSPQINKCITEKYPTGIYYTVLYCYIKGN